MIHIIIEDKTAIISINKNIISENVNIFEDKLNYAKRVGSLNFIFDFNNIEYICSYALDLITSILKVSIENGGKIYFCSLSSKLKNLFEVEKILDIVKTANNIDKTLSNINS